jgi:hypothetical protein
VPESRECCVIVAALDGNGFYLSSRSDGFLDALS